MAKRLTCRHCGEPPDPQLYRNHHGYICRACYMARLTRPPYAAIKSIHQRYESTEKARERKLRYEAKHPERRHKRVYIGRRYVTTTETVDQSQVVNRHIKARLCEFKRQQDERICRSVETRGRSGS